ncbi:hypothetical protein PTKIN_Ptkin06aG0136000 [Pterospermum kingtungense]
MPLQMASNPAIQPGGYFMQHPQAAAMAQQPGIKPGRPNNGMHPMHAEANLGGCSNGGPPPASSSNGGRGGKKQEGSEAGADEHGGDRVEDAK